MSGNPLVDQGILSTISRSRLKLEHPAFGSLHEFYASSANATSNFAESVQSYNRLRVTANNLLLNSQTNFVVSTSSIVTSLWLHVSVQGTAGFKLPADGWLFTGIRSIQFSFSNSILQNMILSGSALKDYLLMTCKTRWHREQLLKLAGSGGSGAVVHYASIPIGHILANASFQSGTWGIDFSILNGPVSLQIDWEPGYRFAVKTDAAFAPPTQWASCEIAGTTSDLVDANFAMKSSMAMDPTLVQRTPGKYLNAITYNLANVNVGAEQTINLQSAPAGQLTAIILNIRPQGGVADLLGGENADTPPTVGSRDWFGIPDGTALIHGESVQLSSLRLSYGGQNLVDLRSNREIRAMLTAAFNGDDLSYDIRSCRQAGTNATVGEQVYHSNVLVIPFGYNMRRIMSDKLIETLPGYSGASMQLYFTVAQGTYSANATPYTDAADPNVIQNGLAYQVSVCYVIESLIEISQGTVDMIL